MYPFITLALSLFTTQAAPQENILARLPDWTNALVAVDLKNILASPIAQREAWDRLSPSEFLGSSMPFPRNANLSILAAHLEPGTLRSQRTLSIVQGGPFPNQADLAKFEQGSIETVADIPAVLTPKNAYVLALNSKQLAVFSPAHRQDAARWIRSTQTNPPVTITNYLQQSYGTINDGYHIVIAIDLSDAIDPHLVKRFLGQSPLLKGKKLDLDALAKVLTSSRGIRIGVRFDQTIKATLAGDFSDNIKSFADILPALVLSTLSDMGGELDEFPAASAVVQDKAFLITTALSNRGLLKVMSLVPPINGPVLAGRDPGIKAAAGDNGVQASQRYFKTIREIANDAHNAADKRNDMIVAAQGYERAAGRIDQLAVGGIDEDLVKYSTFASSKLRTIADVLRNCVLEATAIQSGRKVNVQFIPGFYTGYTLGPWNPQNPGDPYSPQGLWIQPTFTPPTYNVRTNDAELQAKQAVVIANGAKQRLELWRQLSDETANLRKKMSIKYKVDF